MDDRHAASFCRLGVMTSQRHVTMPCTGTMQTTTMPAWHLAGMICQPSNTQLQQAWTLQQAQQMPTAFLPIACKCSTTGGGPQEWIPLPQSPIALAARGHTSHTPAATHPTNQQGLPTVRINPHSTPMLSSGMPAGSSDTRMAGTAAAGGVAYVSPIKTGIPKAIPTSPFSAHNNQDFPPTDHAYNLSSFHLQDRASYNDALPHVPSRDSSLGSGGIPAHIYEGIVPDLRYGSGHSLNLSSSGPPSRGRRSGLSAASSLEHVREAGDPITNDDLDGALESTDMDLTMARDPPCSYPFVHHPYPDPVGTHSTRGTHPAMPTHSAMNTHSQPQAHLLSTAFGTLAMDEAHVPMDMAIDDAPFWGTSYNAPAQYAGHAGPLGSALDLEMLHNAGYNPEDLMHDASYNLGKASEARRMRLMAEGPKPRQSRLPPSPSSIMDQRFSGGSAPFSGGSTHFSGGSAQFSGRSRLSREGRGGSPAPNTAAYGSLWTSPTPTQTPDFPQYYLPSNLVSLPPAIPVCAANDSASGPLC